MIYLIKYRWLGGAGVEGGVYIDLEIAIEDCQQHQARVDMNGNEWGYHFEVVDNEQRVVYPVPGQEVRAS